MYFPMQKFLSVEEQKRKLAKIALEGADDSNSVTQLAKIKIRGVGK